MTPKHFCFRFRDIRPQSRNLISVSGPQLGSRLKTLSWAVFSVLTSKSQRSNTLQWLTAAGCITVWLQSYSSVFLMTSSGITSDQLFHSFQYIKTTNRSACSSSHHAAGWLQLLWVVWLNEEGNLCSKATDSTLAWNCQLSISFAVSEEHMQWLCSSHGGRTEDELWLSGDQNILSEEVLFFVPAHKTALHFL